MRPYIKDKGDAFFKAGNYRSALSAYTQAVETEKQAGPCTKRRLMSQNPLKLSLLRCSS